LAVQAWLGGVRLGLLMQERQGLERQDETWRGVAGEAEKCRVKRGSAGLVNAGRARFGDERHGMAWRGEAMQAWWVELRRCKAGRGRRGLARLGPVW